ncbi:MAG TPA: response regulator transcription factor [Dongiaceae bacterium]|nr:response regulator transcription factor [Dongiaceae bacterium]
MARPTASADPKGPEAPRDIVLVVDDSPDTLGFLTQAIETTGATVLVALDGESALSLTEQITPDLILMDAMMPGIGGFEACRRLKATEHLAQVPVIFMTGLSETEHIVRGLEAGGVDYLTKPIVVDELLARMRVHLRNARRSELAHSALDATGRYMLSVGPDGDIHWATPQAVRLLRSLGLASEDGKGRLPAGIVEWLGGADNHPLVQEIGGKRLELAHLGQVRAGERLLRLNLVEPDDQIDRLRRHFALTGREAEVLLWVARGKSNKDISGVLQISPRTVNKHLEQVFEKLGVENRASAAAVTIEALHRLEEG